MNKFINVKEILEVYIELKLSFNLKNKYILY